MARARAWNRERADTLFPFPLVLLRRSFDTSANVNCMPRLERLALRDLTERADSLLAEKNSRSECALDDFKETRERAVDDEVRILSRF